MEAAAERLMSQESINPTNLGLMVTSYQVWEDQGLKIEEIVRGRQDEENMRTQEKEAQIFALFFHPASKELLLIDLRK